MIKQNNILKHCGLIFLLLFLADNSEAQDMHFSQFYASPLYLSPSLAGGTDGGRLVLNHRNQWPGISKAFTTSAVSFDNFFTRFNSGIGVQIIQDKAGSANLSFTHAALQYSYNVRINDDLQFVPGIQFAYGSRALDFSKLIFADESISGGASGSWERLANENTEFVDFAISGLIYNARFWTGITIDHLAQPNHSLLGEEIKLDRKYVVFGGANIWTEQRRRVGLDRAFATSFRFQRQSTFNQLDLGFYWFNNPIEVGIWYRGLPIFGEVKNRLNHDAVILLMSYKYGPFRFGYSYDITVSNLALQSAGAHEISLIFEFNQQAQLRIGGRRPAVPCSDAANPLIDAYKYRQKRRRVF
ncbi:PorP/SprF family type IX secretion system membrane protein [Alkaliflexus imshenetskii]|uniref:PorP/SprF family type IX secretion system membrane protein n=1 Tax=Alkaliflexus imshenetskii TaxID=286730 RepID=UPI0005C4F075|nr:PorP/SprF family type IX secretion system membrane protein [Alkaliflexus imshenetskii]